MRSSFQNTLDSNRDAKNVLIVHRTENANIPVILTAPHGGLISCGSQSMTARPFLPGVVTRGDLHTMDLLILIDEYVRRRTCNEKRPHIVAAKFHRQYIDANRNGRVESQVAYHADCTVAKDLYEQYHCHINDCVAHSLDSSPYSRALLLDIHGMGPYSDYIIAGTLNGQTCSVAGPQSVSRPHMGFLWHLRGLLGTTILPPPGCADFPQYSGGYTVARHGGGRVDALQLEFGGFLRTVQMRNQVADAVGEAILRTVQPMRAFLQTLAKLPTVQWRNDDIDHVEIKLRKAGCLTPADIAERLSCINKVFEKQGARKFFKKTLRVMLDMFENSKISMSTMRAQLSSGSLARMTPHDAKVLPRDFVMNNLQDLIFSPCLNSAPAPDSPSGGQVLTISDSPPSTSSNIGKLASSLSCHEGDSVRRIFIYDEVIQLQSEQLGIESDSSARSCEEGIETLIATEAMSHFDDFSDALNESTQSAHDSESDFTTSNFSVEQFLSEGTTCPAKLLGFRLVRKGKRCICLRSGVPSDIVRGHLVTFSDPAVFALRKNYWLEYMSGCSDKLAPAIVPVLAGNTTCHRSGDKGLSDTAKESCDSVGSKGVLPSPNPNPPPAPSLSVEEYLFRAIVCYHTADHPHGHGLLQRQNS